MKPNLGFDFGYTYLFSASNPRLNYTQKLSENSTYTVNSGSGKFRADLVGAQVVWAIGKVDAAPMK